MVDRSRLTEDEDYLATLSISSLASDDERSDKEDDLPLLPHIRQRKFQKALAANQTYSMKDDGEQSLETLSVEGLPRRELHRLDPGHPTYATLEQGGKIACLQFTIEKDLKNQDVVALSVYCVPHYVMDDDFMACAKKRRQRGTDFLGLQFELTMNDLSPIAPQDMDENHSIGNSLALSRGSRKGDSPEHGKQPSIKLKAHLFNGTYTLVVSTSHGSLKAGEYTLMVSIQPEIDEEDGREKHSFLFHQDIRVMYDIVPEVKANAIAINSSVTTSVKCKEYVYYRIVLADRLKSISFKVHSTEGDVDIFVTNQFDGLVAVTQENAVWQNTDPIDSVLTILPEDINLIDLDRHGGRNVETFLVGLFGHGDAVNNCVFTVSAFAPLPVTKFVLSSEYEGEEAGSLQQQSQGSTAGNSGSGSRNNTTLNHSINDGAKGRSESENFVLPLHEYRYFSVQFNPVERGRLAMVMDIRSLSTTGSHLKLHDRYLNMDTLITEQQIDTCTGTALYGKVQHLKHQQTPQITSFSTVDIALSDTNGSNHDDILPPPPHTGAAQPGWTPSKSASSPSATHSSSSKSSSKKKAISSPIISGKQHERVQYMVVVYASATVSYPSHEQYTWKVSGHDKAVFILDTSEWRYLSNTCYFSVFIFKYKPIELRQWRPLTSTLDDIDNAVTNAMLDAHKKRQEEEALEGLGSDLGGGEDTTSSAYVLKMNQNTHKREFMTECSVWLEEEEKVLLSSEMFQQRFKIFDDLYRAIDGFRLSYRDRRELLAGTLEFELSKDEMNELDDHTLTYVETEFQGFRDFLQAAGAVDGQIFYDLGSGVGKAMIAAALSGICFVKVIGVELLPSLIQCSRDVIEELTSQVRTTQNTSLNQSGSHSHINLFNTSGTGLILRAGGNVQPEMAPGQAAILANMFPPLSPVRKGNHSASQQSSNNNNNTNNNNANLSNISHHHPNINREFIAVGGGGTTNLNNLSGFSGGSHAGLLLMDDLSVVSSSTYSYQVNAIPDLKEKLKRAKISLPMIETRNENFLTKSDWSDADIVFTNAICFSDYHLQLLLLKMAQQLKVGGKWLTSKMPEGYQLWFVVKKPVSCHSSVGRMEYFLLERNSTVYAPLA